MWQCRRQTCATITALHARGSDIDYLVLISIPCDTLPSVEDQETARLQQVAIDGPSEKNSNSEPESCGPVVFTHTLWKICENSLAYQCTSFSSSCPIIIDSSSVAMDVCCSPVRQYYSDLLRSRPRLFSGRVKQSAESDYYYGQPTSCYILQ